MGAAVDDPTGWALVTEPLEMLPFNDIYEHTCGLECRCGPELNEDEVIVHNAFDQREDYIERGRKLN